MFRNPCEVVRFALSGSSPRSLRQTLNLMQLKKVLPARDEQCTDVRLLQYMSGILLVWSYVSYIMRYDLLASRRVR